MKKALFADALVAGFVAFLVGVVAFVATSFFDAYSKEVGVAIVIVGLVVWLIAFGILRVASAAMNAEIADEQENRNQYWL